MIVKKQTKSEIVEKIFESTKYDIKDVRIIVDFFLESVKSSLEENKSVELRGFGTFEIRERKGRSKARNPKTGAIVSVEDHAVVAFRSGKELKNNVWDMPSRSQGGKSE